MHRRLLSLAPIRMRKYTSKRRLALLVLALLLMHLSLRVGLRVRKLLTRAMWPTPPGHHHVGFSVCGADKHPEYLDQLHFMLHTLLLLTTLNLHFHVVVESSHDFTRARDVIMDVADELAIEAPLVSEVKIGNFVKPSRYQTGHPLFTLARRRGNFCKEDIALYPYLRDLQGVSEIIILDTDLMFAEDIGGLFLELQRFPEGALIGAALEFNPSFFANFERYREAHPNAQVVGTYPRRMLGLNPGGVLALKMDKMRNSADYGHYLTQNGSAALQSKYQFRLEDESNRVDPRDFFTALSLERPEMFYFLKCSWNRNLCATENPMYHGCSDWVKVYRAKCMSIFARLRWVIGRFLMLLSHL